MTPKTKYFFSILIVSIFSGITPLYAGPVTDGLVGYWQLNGNGEDATTSNFDGVLSGGASYVYSDAVFQESLHVSGGSYFQVPSNSLLNLTDEITISLWIKPNSLSSYQSLVAKWANTSSGQPASERSYLFYIKDSNLLPFVQTGGIISSYESSPVLTQGEWQQVTMTYSSSDESLKAYLNGSYLGEQYVTGLMSSTNTMPLLFGAFSYSGGAYSFSGYIDEVKIFDRALTQPEINEDYQYVLNGMQTPVPEPLSLVLLSIASLFLRIKKRM
ncbi:MAG: LamG domain-containing protein [Candidatus Auribacter fodinae]|jgi:hypothetical protein|uniref:LamG domain-containing protein n=1 Tax=Candidatus Auribacter fodinae TaxID=2093366 RepID=A0A3A4R1U9_9BACT|nr:MAG: LamG domain-containing protein [Candidatus Auribacter fodinae]